MNKIKTKILLFALLIFTFVQIINGQTNTFTYQGRLSDSLIAANGTYQMQFALFNAETGGTQIGATQTNANVTVAGGVFSVQLNFAAANAYDGNTRFLEISVKKANEPTYTTLTPRQPLTSAPYSIRSSIATTAVNALNVNGTPADQIIKEGDTRLTDERTPFAGSANYVQNRATEQTATNFNISGNGTVGGTLSSGVVNSAAQYNIGGNRVFGIYGTGNTFAGINTGNALGQGKYNSFFGNNAGLNTSNTDNSLFGSNAGVNNSLGFGNSFFGQGTGLINTTGSYNTLLGNRADFGANNLTYATAIGAGSIVSANNTVVIGRNLDTVQIPGNLNVTGTLTGNISGANLTNLNASNIASGILDNARLGIVSIAKGGTGSATQNFVDLTTAQTVGGNKTFSATLSGNIVNAATQFNIGGNRVFSAVAGGANNTFVGFAAGANTIGTKNVFVGEEAGFTNSSGGNNAFFGFAAGRKNTTGVSNSFFGLEAGSDNTSGNNNSFVGRHAGRFNNIGSENVFFGVNSGLRNSSGNQNVFLGVQAGNSNTTGSSNTIIGTAANVSASNLTFATAIGAGAIVAASNTVALGRSTDTVQIPGNLNVSGTINGNKPLRKVAFTVVSPGGIQASILHNLGTLDFQITVYRLNEQGQWLQILIGNFANSEGFVFFTTDVNRVTVGLLQAATYRIVVIG